MIPLESSKHKSSATKSEEFHPIIIHKNNSFCVYLPEWRVSGVGSTLEEAYLKYEHNVSEIEANAVKFGLYALTPEPYPTLKKTAVLQKIGLYLAKVSASIFVVVLMLVLLLPNISASIRHNLRTLVPAELTSPKYWAIQFPTKMNERLGRLKPEEETQMREEWSRLLGRTVPIFDPLICQSQKETKNHTSEVQGVKR
tara:strand:+ start:1824 stop:2417 length:594 start_codon:yes stop_codon:yes gene_type:complete